MEVLHPDPIVRLQQRHELLGEQPDHVAIDPIPLVLERSQVDPVVKQRPQGAVGHAAIVPGMFRLRQVEKRVGYLAAFDQLEPALRGIRDEVAAPAEPDAARVSQRREHANR